VVEPKVAIGDCSMNFGFRVSLKCVDVPKY